MMLGSLVVVKMGMPTLNATEASAHAWECVILIKLRSVVATATTVFVLIWLSSEHSAS